MVKKSINNIKISTTSHGIGAKRVLLKHEETKTDITQIALTKFKSGEEVEPHSHKTMEEFFYMLTGKVIIEADEVKHECTAGDFIQLKANELHGLQIIEDTEMIAIGCGVKSLI